MKSTTVRIALALASVALAGTAWATGTDSSHTIAVSSTVNTSCVVTSGTLAFGTYDPVGANATTPAGDLAGTASFTLKCTKGASVTVSMDNGLHATGSQRAMQIGATTNQLQYNLFQPVGFTPTPTASSGTCPGTQAWNATGAGIFSFTSGSSATNTVNVCGTVPGAQDASAGSYTDTVTMTVTF